MRTDWIAPLLASVLLCSTASAQLIDGCSLPGDPLLPPSGPALITGGQTVQWTAPGLAVSQNDVVFWLVGARAPQPILIGTKLTCPLGGAGYVCVLVIDPGAMVSSLGPSLGPISVPQGASPGIFQIQAFSIDLVQGCVHDGTRRLQVSVR